MKAAVQHEYGDPRDVFAVEDVVMPVPKDDEILVRVNAAGVNWADQSMTLGKPYVMRLGYGMRRPRKGIRGTDFAGTVEQVGSGAKDFGPGDEVIGWSTGTFAEYTTLREGHAVSKPASVTFEEAAGIPMAGSVALQALRDVGRVEPGQSVMVIGASGGIGSFAVQIAKALGAEVTGVCSTPNLDLVRSIGADHVIDYTENDYLAGDRKYDVILDMADKHSLSARRRVLKAGGTLIPNSGEGGPLLGSIGRILKARLASPFVSQKLKPFLSLSKKEDLEQIVELINDAKVAPIVGRSYPLSEVGMAIADAGSGHARGKVVVNV